MALHGLGSAYDTTARKPLNCIENITSRTLNDDELFHAARRLFQTQIETNMHSDGEVIDFAQRDALHYVLYDLEPLAHAALAARRRGEDWFNLRGGNGATLAKGFAWLKP